jgi:mannose-6-phosphate isomerase-like protein (cupin superfamily)
MPVVTAPDSPTHDLGPTRFTSLASPSRGSRETSIWQVEIDAGSEPTPHSLSREELFVVLSGTASVRIDGVEETAASGDAIIVPRGVTFELRNNGADPLRLLCCMPVGGQACMAEGAPFTPPWAE